MQPNYVIDYGFNHGRSLILQLNRHAINKVKFLNWDWNLVAESEEPYIVAIWRFKTRH